MDNINLIRRVIATLDSVDVRGRENMDKLLGCMMTLDSIAAQLEKEAAEHADADAG